MTLILLIDDDPIIADAVAATLEPEGFRVRVLLDGTRAVEVVESRRPAMVLLDCSLPGLPWIDVLRQIRNSPVCFAIPVLILTARATRPDREIAYRAGATAYMAKPFERTQLVTRIDRLIGPCALSSSSAPQRMLRSA